MDGGTGPHKGLEKEHGKEKHGGRQWGERRVSVRDRYTNPLPTAAWLLGLRLGQWLKADTSREQKGEKIAALEQPRPKLERGQSGNYPPGTPRPTLTSPRGRKATVDLRKWTC